MLPMILLIAIAFTFCGIHLSPFYPKTSDVLGVIGVTTLLIVLLSAGFEFITNF